MRLAMNFDSEILTRNQEVDVMLAGSAMAAGNN